MKRIACLFVMLMAVSLLSYAQFDKPIRVSDQTTDSIPNQWPQVAFGPDGILHIVWVELTTSFENKVLHRSWDGTNFSEIDVLSQSGTHRDYFPYIAINNKGKMVVIWVQDDEHWMAVYDPQTKAWLPPEEVAGPDYGSGFLSRPKVALDDDGNIYCFFFNQWAYNAYSRSKINGVWENIFLLNNPGRPCKEGGICAAPNGWVWVVYGLKMDDGNYKVGFRKRTKDTDWTNGDLVQVEGASHEQPFIGVGLNSIPYVSIIANAGTEGDNAINIYELNEAGNPGTNAAPSDAYHYPRVAVDNEGYQWIASQFGQGDEGIGVKYFDNTSGEWINHGIMHGSWNGWTKLPGIGSEAYGNIAISFDAFPAQYACKQSYFATRYPVVAKNFYPPANIKATVSVKGIMSSSPSIVFKLSWERNPDNNEDYLQGYRIYKKANTGDWELLAEVTKNTFSYEVAHSVPMTEKIQFAIATVSVAGFEGERATF